MPSMEELAARARGGDNEAWAALFAELEPQVYAVARRSLTAFAGMDADDVRGVIMRETWVALGSHDPAKGRLNTWVVRCVVSRLGHLRKGLHVDKRRLLDETVRPTDGWDRIDVADHAVSDDFDRAERRIALAQAVAALDLSPTERKVAEAVLASPFASIAELAAITGVSDSSVSRVFRTIAQRAK